MEETSPLKSSKTKREKLSSEARKERLIKFFREAIFRGFSRLEVYKIIIDDIRGDQTSIDRISISSSLNKEIIYQREEGEEIPIGKPIRLRGPSRPPACADPVVIFFGPEDRFWYFQYDPFRRQPTDPNPSCKEVIDKNGSVARVFYQKIVRSVEADIEIVFYSEDLGFWIEGEIFATTEGNHDTKRILLRPDRGTSFKPNTCLKLDRSVVALSLKSVLHISFDLTIRNFYRKFEVKLDDLKFEVPEGPKVQLLELPVKVSDLMQKRLISGHNTFAHIPEDFKIKVQVTWSNDRSLYYNEKEMAEFDVFSGSEDEV